jgi:hypothetical protein
VFNNDWVQQQQHNYLPEPWATTTTTTTTTSSSMAAEHLHELDDEFCLECFAEELLLHILSFLDTFSLHQLSLVSTRLYRIANDRTLWESLYQRGASEEQFSCIIRDTDGSDMLRTKNARRLWEQQMKKYAHLRSSCVLQPDQEYHIVVAGPGNAGKSPIVERFIFNYFIPRYDPTVEDSMYTTHTHTHTHSLSLSFDLVGYQTNKSIAVVRLIA